MPEYEVCGEPGVPPGGDDVERPPAPQVPALQVRPIFQELKSEDAVVGLGRFFMIMNFFKSIFFYISAPSGSDAV